MTSACPSCRRQYDPYRRTTTRTLHRCAPCNARWAVHHLPDPTEGARP